jgi:predicted nucleic acid-binding protein
VSEPWIVNASPSIVLGRVGCLELLDSLNPMVRIPQAVIEEIRAGLTNDPCATATLQWAMRHCLDNRPVPGSIAMWGLGAGESQVLSRCVHDSGTAVLDDLAARRCAKAHRIPVIGTLGIILAAKRGGLIPLARPVAEQAVAAGLYLDKHLLDGALASVGE